MFRQFAVSMLIAAPIIASAAAHFADTWRAPHQRDTEQTAEVRTDAPGTAAPVETVRPPPPMLENEPVGPRDPTPMLNPEPTETSRATITPPPATTPPPANQPGRMSAF